MVCTTERPRKILDQRRLEADSLRATTEHDHHRNEYDMLMSKSMGRRCFSKRGGKNKEGLMRF